MRVKNHQKRAKVAFTKPFTIHLMRGKGDFSVSPNVAFQGQWKQTVAGNKTIQLISTVFLFFFDLLHAGCGPVIEHTLRSPGYPNDYPNNTDCISWFPIQQGMVVNITINELYLEDSISCE